MSHLCDSTVAKPAAQRDNVLASNADTSFPLLPINSAIFVIFVGKSGEIIGGSDVITRY